MAGYESNNAVVKETLAQVHGIMDLLRGNMETILEIIQAQRASTSANPTVANVTNVVGVTNATVDVVATIKTLVETVVQIAVNQHMFPSVENRLAVAYSWGIHSNFSAQFANGGAFLPHQALIALNAVGNVVFPLGAPTI